MNRSITLFIFLLYFSSYAFGASSTKLDWYSGEAILNTGECITGDLSYNSSLDIILIKSNNVIKSYGASKVDNFTYYDEYYEMNRKFVALEYKATEYSYSARIFFEVMLEGKIVLLFRDNNDGLPFEYNPPNEYPFNSIANHISRHSYFAYIDGQFSNLKDFTKRVLPTLQSRFESELSVFIDKYDLKPNQLDNQILLIDYFNHLLDPKDTYAGVNNLLTSNKWQVSNTFFLNCFFYM